MGVFFTGGHDNYHCDWIGDTPEEHDYEIVHRINQKVRKYDTLYICGDHRLSGIRCLTIRVVNGLENYSNHWLSHIPIQTNALHSKKNIHSHHPMVLDGKIDRRYINVSIEALNGYPIEFDDIEYGKYWHIQQLTEVQ